MGQDDQRTDIRHANELEMAQQLQDTHKKLVRTRRNQLNCTEENMSKKNVEELLIAGGSDEEIRKKYDVIKTMEEFVSLAEDDGYKFSITDLEDVLRESGDSFESFGNPPKRMIWWQ